MCRLFGLSAGSRTVAATFWLLHAPDSLIAQSHRMPDGAGIGVFGPDGAPHVDKQPMAAWRDVEFATAARDLTGTTFVAHVRYASAGGLSVANTHPFLQDGRLLAHNGGFAGLDRLDAHLAELGVSGLVAGQTDTERMFALITAEIRRCGGDVQRGLIAAVGWIAAHLPVYALNIVLITRFDLWALRYPDTHDLYLLEREPTGEDADLRSRRIRASSSAAAQVRTVVVASEPMDRQSGWRLLASGELVHVGADAIVTSSFPLPPPAHAFGLSEMAPAAAAAHAPSAQTSG